MACIQRIKELDFEIHALSSRKIVNKKKDFIYWHQVDLTNKDQIDDVFNKIKPRYLLHLAWDVSKKDYNDNHHYQWVKIGIDLIEAFNRNGGKRIVASGTCAEYDWKYGCCSEKFTPIKCENAYGQSKHSFQLILESFSRENNLSYAWGRIFFAYGPGMNKNSLIPYTVDNLKKNKDVKIMNGNLIRDFIYIDDIADIFVKLLNSDFVGPINVSTGNPIKLSEIVNKIGDYFGKRELIDFNQNDSKNYDSHCVLGDNYRLYKYLQWQPKFSFEEGLKKTIESMN